MLFFALSSQEKERRFVSDSEKPQMLEHLGLGNAVKFNALLGLQGVDGICDASLASRDCTLSTGGAQES